MALTKEDLNVISGLLEPLSNKITALQDHVENVTDRNLAALQDHVENVTDRNLAALQDHVENVTDRNLESLSMKVTSLQLHIENETDHYLRIVAENHVALNDKLDQLLADREKDKFIDVEIASLKARVSRLEDRENTA